VAYDKDLADRSRELVAGEAGLTEQKVFGGLAFLIGRKPDGCGKQQRKSPSIRRERATI
jgi:hypothetical protein